MLNIFGLSEFIVDRSRGHVIPGYLVLPFSMCDLFDGDAAIACPTINFVSLIDVPKRSPTQPYPELKDNCKRSLIDTGLWLELTG